MNIKSIDNPPSVKQSLASVAWEIFKEGELVEKIVLGANLGYAAGCLLGIAEMILEKSDFSNPVTATALAAFTGLTAACGGMTVYILKTAREDDYGVILGNFSWPKPGLPVSRQPQPSSTLEPR